MIHANPISRHAIGRRLLALAAPLLILGTTLVMQPAGASSLTVTFTATSVDFGSLTVGTSLQSQVVVTNTTSSTLYLKEVDIHGSDVNQFSESPTGCASAISAGSSCDLAVTFAPKAAGLKSTALGVTLGAKGSGGQFIALATVQAALTGTGVVPTFSLSDASAGAVKIGDIGTADSVLTNTSNVPLIVHQWNLQNVVHNSFSLTSGTCPTPVAPGQSCDFVFAFSPKAQGNSSATFTVKMSVVGASSQELISQQATISGSGTTSGSAGAPFSVSSLDFGSVEVGTSSTGSVALTNTSTGTVKLISHTLRGDGEHDYTVTGTTCVAALAPAASCTISVTFTPSLPRLRNATLGILVRVVIGTSHSQVAAVTSLSGTGLRPTISVVAPDFGSVTIGSSTSAQVILTNTSVVTLHYGKSKIAGPHLPSWSISSTTCRGDLAPSASCQVELTFAPHTQGDLSTVMNALFYIHTLHHDVPVAGQTTVSGAGVEPTFSVSAPSFSTVAKHVASVGEAVITNTSNVALSFSSSNVFGSNPDDFHVSGTTCAGQLAPSATCNVTVVFKPLQSTSGARSASLKIFMTIDGISPSATVSDTVALSGQES